VAGRTLHHAHARVGVAGAEGRGSEGSAPAHPSKASQDDCIGWRLGFGLWGLSAFADMGLVAKLRREKGQRASAHGQRDLEAAGSAMPPIQEDVVHADKLAAHLLVVLRGAAVRADLDEETVAGEVGGGAEGAAADAPVACGRAAGQARAAGPAPPESTR